MEEERDGEYEEGGFEDGRGDERGEREVGGEGTEGGGE